MVSTGNTKIPSYLTILSKGYKVSLEMTDSGPSWSASNASIRHFSHDLDSLLGVVTMSEIRGVNWKATREDMSLFWETFPQLKKDWKK